MIYRDDKYGNPISQLAFGCMRLSKKGGKVDIDKAAAEISYAIEQGVNYFDTAYIYRGNEEALGEVFERLGNREKINIATKLPQYMVKNHGSLDKYFNEQLSRLRTDYIDYYLMHMLTDKLSWEHLLQQGVEKWIEEKKASGQIRNIGFSYHGNTENFLPILDAYDWDFCMIQYNYLDETSQAGRKGLEAAYEKGIPVFIMEPLQGGRLISGITDEGKKLLEKSGEKPAELALRWLWDQKEVTSVLSGMNSLEMVKENIALSEEAEAGCMTEEEKGLADSIRNLIVSKMQVPCTECGYCMPCPFGVDIPGAFRGVNDMALHGRISGRIDYYQVVALREKKQFPRQCRACGKCEKHCPQGIHIIEELKKADKKLMPLPFRIGVEIARRYMLKGLGKRR